MWVYVGAREGVCETAAWTRTRTPRRRRRRVDKRVPDLCEAGEINCNYGSGEGSKVVELCSRGEHECGRARREVHENKVDAHPAQRDILKLTYTLAMYRSAPRLVRRRHSLALVLVNSARTGQNCLRVGVHRREATPSARSNSRVDATGGFAMNAETVTSQARARHRAPTANDGCPHGVHWPARAVALEPAVSSPSRRDKGLSRDSLSSHTRDDPWHLLYAIQAPHDSRERPGGGLGLSLPCDINPLDFTTERPHRPFPALSTILQTPVYLCAQLRHPTTSPELSADTTAFSGLDRRLFVRRPRVDLYGFPTASTPVFSLESAHAYF